MGRSFDKPTKPPFISNGLARKFRGLVGDSWNDGLTLKNFFVREDDSLDYADYAAAHSHVINDSRLTECRVYSLVNRDKME